LELQHHQNIPEQHTLIERIIELHKKTGIPLVATNDIHYLRPEDAEAQGRFNVDQHRGGY
jgi:DNA polymerase-3 subunit alpha